jgi:heat shock protein HtpX
MWNQIKTIVLLGALSAVLIGFGGMLGRGWLYAFGALALLMNVGAYFYSDRLVLRMSGARALRPDEAPRLFGMVAELAARAEIPAPRLYLVEDPQPNAFATGRNPSRGAVAVTTGIVELLSPRELRGVLAHELAHIRNRDVLVASVAATLASAVSSIANVFQFSALFGGATASSDDEEGGTSPLAALALAVVAPVAATLIQLGISRSREFLADEEGARLSGDPEALALALEKLELAAAHVPGAAQPATASLYIVNPLLGLGGLAGWFSTHPPMRERVARLRALARQRAWAAA